MLFFVWLERGGKMFNSHCFSLLLFESLSSSARFLLFFPLSSSLYNCNGFAILNHREYRADDRTKQTSKQKHTKQDETKQNKTPPLPPAERKKKKERMKLTQVTSHFKYSEIFSPHSENIPERGHFPLPIKICWILDRFGSGLGIGKCWYWYDNSIPGAVGKPAILFPVRVLRWWPICVFMHSVI